MDELEINLVRCILSIFPTLTEEDVRTSDVSQLIAADSLAAVTLVSLIDEEFGVNFDFESLLKMGTFNAIRDNVRERQSSNHSSGE